jgi:hypothetical protein
MSLYFAMIAGFIGFILKTVIIFWKLRENGTNVESSLGPLKTVCRKIVANVRFARIGPTVDALGLCTV